MLVDAMPNMADGIPLCQMSLPPYIKCGKWSSTVADVTATIMLTGVG